MIEAAIGMELSRSIFSNGKRHVTGKGKENETGMAGNQQATKRTARDRAPVGVTHGTHYTMGRYVPNSTTAMAVSIPFECGIRFQPSMPLAPPAIPRTQSTRRCPMSVSGWARHSASTGIPAVS